MKMKSIFTLLAFLSFTIFTQAQIVINEIMYNPPETGEDFHEYIELYNNGSDTIDLKDYEFTDGIKHKFDTYLFAPDTYLVLVKDSVAIADLGLTDAIVWTDGSLKNSGENIAIADPDGNTIDEVKYDDGGEWVSEPDGDGPSLELCSPDEDNSLAKNWKASTNPTGYNVDGKQLLGTPGFANSVTCDTSVAGYGDSLVISEILYNDSGDPDSLEFVEIVNIGQDSVKLNEFSISSKSFTYDFENYILAPNEHYVICKNPETFQRYFGFSPVSWDIGGLSNKGDSLTIINKASDKLIDMVVYEDEGDWSDLADGAGYSLSLCYYKSDNNDGKNWQASPVYAGFKYNDKEVHANPGQKNICRHDFSLLKEVDSLGVIINNGLKTFASGTVYGINYNPNGLQFVLYDDNSQGIWIYSGNKNFGYNLHEGDHIDLWGNLSQFRGLAQIKPDSVVLVKVDSVLQDPVVINKLNEDIEGSLVTMKDVHILDPAAWTNSGSGFNIKVTDGTDTITVRIDKDTDIYGKAYPSGTFDITGLVGQYDKNPPYFDGYQLLPRYSADIDPFNSDNYPVKKIGEVTNVDEEGVGTSLGVTCELRGVVYGINLRPSGLQFTIIDNLNDGIAVYNKNGNFGYEVTEGDYIAIKGHIGQYKGLLQIYPDTIIKLSEDNGLYPPKVVDSLGEYTESQLILLNEVYIKDLTKWKGDGTSFNVTVTDGTNDFTMRIDNDVDLSTMAAPDYKFNLTGIGGQYDPTKPYDSGYQIMPRYKEDIEKVDATFDIADKDITVYPNPATDKIIIDSKYEIEKIEIFNSLGRKVLSTTKQNVINISKLKTGIYNLHISTKEGVISKAIIKM